jgi:hypothetical protein
MAVFSFEWKYGPGGSDSPQQVPLDDVVIWKEPASSTWKKGYPLQVDTSESDATQVELIKGVATKAAFFIAQSDANNNSAELDLNSLSTAGLKLSLPMVVRPGDVFSVTLSNDGTNAATSAAYIGGVYGWKASGESGETDKAVLDINNTTNVQWLVLGFDDRDAPGTSGGRMIVMFVGHIVDSTLADAQG